MLIIGELLNATRKKIKEAVLAKDAAYLQEVAKQQDEAGADYIDLNVATGSGKQEKEIEDMQWAVTLIREVTAKPLTIDTTSLEVLQAGLAAHGPGAMINSISAETGRLFPFLKLAREYECTAIALPVRDAGIPRDTETRLKISQEILEAAEKEGVPRERLYFDPLTLPLGVEDNSGAETLRTLKEMKGQLGLLTTLGLSNISYGLPLRALVNRTYLTLAISAGLDSALINPLDKGVMSSMHAALLGLGKDPYCSAYLRAFRKGSLVV